MKGLNAFDDYCKMIIMSKFIELNEKELDRIWRNTRKTWKTADCSEVATFFEFVDGITKSGYNPNLYEGILVNYTLPIIKKSEAKQIFDAFINKIRCSLPDDLSYHYPSNLLTSQDLHSNPELLALFLGELSPFEYVGGKIETDSENREIMVKGYRYDNKSGQCYNFTQKEALKKAAEISSKVSTIKGNFSFDFENPYLLVGGKPLYETGAINENLMKKREAEKRLELVKNSPKARQGVETALANYEANIASEKGAYFPMFK
ncbi:MAG: hypothetical protein KKB25_02505, partial [Nanoarchaeota archaeon]|nr:hypothetical protein [Nanoarchaeota archaeon]